MNKLFSGILACLLMLSPLTAAEIDTPIKMEVTGVVIVKNPKIDLRNPKKPKKLGNSAIINDRIWWEGDTIKVRKEDNTWVTLTLTKVEMVEGKGGVVTFTVEDGSNDKPTFKVTIKKKSSYGLEKPAKKAKKKPAKKAKTK